MKMYVFFFIMIFTIKGFSQKIICKPTFGLNHNLGSNDNFKKIKGGFNFGILIEREINKKIFLETGFYYSTINGKTIREYNNQFIDNYYTVEENYTFSNIKIPMCILFKSKKRNSFIFAFGPNIKFISKVNGYGRGKFYTPISFDTSFLIRTNSGNRIGTGLQTSIRKEFVILNHKCTAGLYYDTDFSNWRYPRNFPYEYGDYIRFREYNIAFLVSINL